LDEALAHDLVILDIMLPGIDGFEVCRSLRAGGSQAMILMMTARDDVRDKVRALDGGADDYVVKPFAMPELLARVRALQRRASEGKQRIVLHGQLAFDQGTGQLSFGEHRLDLTRSEHTILEMLIGNPRRVFSGEHLYERIASLDQRGTPGTVKTHIANIRKKIRAAGGSSGEIVTVYGFGYRLADA
jgi:two-component system response regulator MprA